MSTALSTALLPYNQFLNYVNLLSIIGKGFKSAPITLHFAAIAVVAVAASAAAVVRVADRYIIIDILRVYSAFRRHRRM